MISHLISRRRCQVEAIAGPLDEEAGLIVMGDGDGSGFVCATTGRPPVPLPRPPRELPPLSSLMTRGGIDPSLVALVRKATEAGTPVEDLLERPAEVARRMGLDVSSRTIRDLEALAPSRVDQLEDLVSREVVTFFQRVLIDGRYVDTWAIRPAAVAEALDVQLSDQAANRVVRVGAALSSRMGENAIIWIVVGIIVIVGVVVLEDEAESIDRSGIAKF